MKTVFKILGILVLVLVVLAIGAIFYINLSYPNVGPAPQMTINATPEMVARGDYLFNHVAICVDCHSGHDMTRYGNPPVPGTIGKGGEDFAAFMKLNGTLFTSNITPAALGTWTDGEIVHAMTTGVSKDGRALFPIMPYLNYGKSDQRDIEAIVAYMKTLEPVQNEVPKTSLPFPLSMIIKTVPTKAQFQPRPDTTDQVAHGKYLVTMGSCAECHTQMEKGVPLPGMEYAGGSPFELPFGTVRSANITPDKETGIGSWTKQEFIDKFKMYEAGTYEPPVVGLEGANTVMPWLHYSGMTEYDLGSIYEFLRTVPPVKNTVEKVTLGSQPQVAE